MPTGWPKVMTFQRAGFALSELSLLDRGFIYAIAHVRGGRELGQRWHQEGRLLNKKNSFTDFIACARYLINNGYTRPDRLFASGSSGGGHVTTPGRLEQFREKAFKFAFLLDLAGIQK